MQDSRESLLNFAMRDKQAFKKSYYNSLLPKDDSFEISMPLDAIEIEKLIYFAIVNHHTALLAFITDFLNRRASEKSKKTPQLSPFDINAIRDFFKDKKRVQEQLKKLNQHLERLAKQRGINDEKSCSLKGYNSYLPYKNNKLLSGYFLRWAQENGFSTTTKEDGSPTVHKMEAFLSTEEFMDVIREGHLFKDAAQGGKEHGEWTHFIQWWCLVEANKDSRFLLVTPNELLRLMGNPQSQTWFDLFEIPLEEVPRFKPNNTKFTDVFSFNQYLLSGECATDTPVLHALIKGRANKRMFEQSNGLLFNRDLRINNSLEIKYDERKSPLNNTYHSNQIYNPDKIITFIINKGIR